MKSALRTGFRACFLSMTILGSLALPSLATAGESPAQAVGSVVDFRSANDKSIALSTAIAVETVRRGGYAARYTTNNTTNVGTANSWAYHYGPETSTSSVTQLNSSDTSVTTTVGAGSSNVTVTASTPTTQVSGTALQDADATSNVTPPNQ